jgi:hypothetical protein
MNMIGGTEVRFAIHLVINTWMRKNDDERSFGLIALTVGSLSNSETSVSFCETAPRNIPEVWHLHENLKFKCVYSILASDLPLLILSLVFPSNNEI